MTIAVQFTELKQIPPITSTNATIQVAFVVQGQPDLVQIYAVDAASATPGNLGYIVSAVKVTSAQTSYSATIKLQAGTAYTVYLCPRTENGGVLNDQIDGQYWEAYCVFYSIVTKIASEPSNTLPPPFITGLHPKPATIAQDNSITVTWRSDKQYDKFLVWWTQNGIPLQQGEIDTGGTSGSWTAMSTVPKEHYVFQVKGGVNEFWNYNYSDWGVSEIAAAVPNLTSLRQFLENSGLNPTGQSLRALMHTDSSLKNFMKLA